jgi:hypothetical protein
MSSYVQATTKTCATCKFRNLLPYVLINTAASTPSAVRHITLHNKQVPVLACLSRVSCGPSLQLQLTCATTTCQQCPEC